ncbi:MAG: uroporphyrinogen-III synthase, partial [Chloroflexota bacterium]|nr:uroporphyrinogen-III synthase [Chloroflexota bacterium]
MSRPTRVLNTRPLEQAAELSALLRAAGFEVVEAPAIEIVPRWADAEMQVIRARLRQGQYTWLVLSSGNAARLLSQALGGQPPPVPVLCGETTARTAGLQAAMTLDRFSAAAALEALRPRLARGDCVLIPRAQEGRDELVEGLLAHGIRVDAPVLYATRPMPSTALVALLQGEAIEVVTVCSPSAVQALVTSVGRQWLSERRLVCLG